MNIPDVLRLTSLVVVPLKVAPGDYGRPVKWTGLDWRYKTPQLIALSSSSPTDASALSVTSPSELSLISFAVSSADGI